MTFRKKLGKAVDRVMTNRKETVRLALEAGYDGDYEYALEILDEAIYLFDSVLDTPNTKTEFWHLKAKALQELDRGEEALKAIEKSKEFLEISIKNSLKGIVFPTDDEDYDITLLNDDAEPYVISLLAGHAMVALGRGRRSAKILDLPIEMDTDALIAEGQELIRETLDAVQQNNAFYLALGE